MFVDDLTDGCFFLMENYEDPGLVNVGSGEEVSIRDLVFLLADVVGYEGKIVFDTSKPDGTPRKLMDSSKIQSMGWRHRTALRDGLKVAYHWYSTQKLLAA
jgi:GDP-L-fucose synthase